MSYINVRVREVKSVFLYNVMCREFENKSASVVNNFVKSFFLYFRYIN